MDPAFSPFLSAPKKGLFCFGICGIWKEKMVGGNK
jgi:hypothetical protein